MAYRNLLLVLACVSTVIAAHAFLRQHLASAQSAPAIGQALSSPSGSGDNAPRATLSKPTSSTPSASLSKPASSSPRPVDPSPQRILLFGDSMVPVLVPRLADYCLENGHQLFPAAWYGSTIMYWAWRDNLDKLLVEHNPTMAIAVLGSSELTVRDVAECRPFIRIIARKVGSRKFLWIGPPNWRTDTGVNALVEAELGPSLFFRSAELPLSRRADAIHPNESAGQTWVDAFVRWSLDKSQYPILMQQPTRKAPSVPTRVYSSPFKEPR